MATHFYPLKIASVRRETPECVSISFVVPDDLKNDFAFQPGQHLTIRTKINGTEIRRNYSLCSSPLRKEWRIAIKQLDGGVFSTFANELKPGHIIDVMPPMGKFFTTPDPANKKHYVAIAAGSGITPILSMIIAVLETEPASDFTLIYANKNRDSIIFKESLDDLKNRFMSRFSVHHIFSRERTEAAINEGRIDSAKAALIFNHLVDLKKMDDCFICGPVEVIETVRNYLEQQGVDKKKIHYELFTAAGAGQQATAKKIIVGHDAPAASITIRLDGRDSQFKLAYEGASILDAALQQGADLPYACKGGVCCTCKARLLEGAVKMDLNYGLEPDEVAAGYILTCQSHPITETVKVDFDNR
ncbi:MAG: 1,2-phenylacetyl-CoA epoxidase subunit PaaE [Bacteroidota bacterium]